MSETLSRSRALVAERVARVPARIASAAESPALPLLAAARWTVTGVGGSEGPARLLAHRLARAGQAARFVACSHFALPGNLDATGGLVVFSQGLSPNARGALAVRHGFFPRVVVTAVEARAEGSDAERFLAAQLRDGTHRIPHGPAREGELLVRLEGPAEATVRALQLAAHISDQPMARLRVAGLPEVPPLPAGRLALVGAGDTPAWLHGQRWKLLEGLGLPDPPVYDVMQVAHGPLQQFYEEPMTLLAVVQTPAEQPLFERLGQVLRDHHELRVITLEAPLPQGWPQLELWFDALLLATLKERPRDLIAWPGKDSDAELYALDPSRTPIG